VSRLLRPALGALLALVAAPEAAQATTETASLGPVSATLTYEQTDSFTYTGMTVTVKRGGAVVYEGVASVPNCQVPYCAPAGVLSGSSLKVVNLDGDREPEIVTDFYSGGAHCCTVTQVLRWNGKAYKKATHSFADIGYRLNGRLFVTGDARFAMTFASFADSAFPVQLMTFGAAGWRDVTRAHRTALTADADRWMTAYKQRRSGTLALGMLAAWTADQYRLGRKRAANRFLSAEQHAGRLKGEAAWPRGQAFLSLLKSRLKAWGYA
jgi:hypothetical protein